MNTTNTLDLNEFKKISPDRWYITEQCKNKKVLEIGFVNHSIAGIQEQQKVGTWLFDYLHKYSQHATGIDIDQVAVTYLAEKGYDVRFGNAESFDLNEKYDVIIISKVIDHLLDLNGFLLSCKKHLAPGGKIIISDDNILCMPQLFIWNFKKMLGKPDEDITIKIVPEYFRLFVKRYNLAVHSIQYTSGTGKSGMIRLFRIIAKIIPKWLIYPPLFYPNFILELVHKND